MNKGLSLRVVFFLIVMSGVAHATSVLADTNKDVWIVYVPTPTMVAGSTNKMIGSSWVRRDGVVVVNATSRTEHKEVYRYLLTEANLMLLHRLVEAVLSGAKELPGFGLGAKGGLEMDDKGMWRRYGIPSEEPAIRNLLHFFEREFLEHTSRRPAETSRKPSRSWSTSGQATNERPTTSPISTTPK